ncbi:hypothetical protein PAHAL_5G270100 [Panicum hallii]|uniref:DNA repair protein RAD51 homolog 3 n=1 Tax=Panicum hallii TaxID=206008 RepID=A0A2S3HUH0_9POAL|nr:DNA repair protein RAD51 homolog 3 isoform X3 [Panicum hallii]PAN30047.1 hypothetical protein PAHAL_5G270100 [Panicum hallii]
MSYTGSAPASSSLYWKGMESSGDPHPPILAGAQNAWDMLSDEQSQKHITTGSGDLNNILGGGIHCKEVTEIGGVPGVGKTQLGIQLAINVQIPVEYGGLGGKAVYIDTEGSFMVERVYQIAEGCISDILEHFPHSHDFDDLALRTRVLSGLSLKLMKIAKAFNLAVVLLNQVTTKFTEGSFQLTLALGDSWSHSCTNRLILYWNGNDRYAYLDKSPSLPVASAPYAVTGKGVRDAVSSNHKRVRVT